MSHVVSIAVEIKDLDALAQACQRLGWQLHQRPHKWFGQWVDDSPVPRHLFADEAEYERVRALPRSDRQAFMTQLLNGAVAAIAVPERDYEAGLIRQNGCFTLAWDAWHGELNLNPLVQLYGVEKAKLEAKKSGFLCEEQQLQDGTIKLRLTQL